MLRLTKQINEAIPCSPYLSHGTFRLYLSYLATSLKSIRENMILWFLNIRHSFWYVVPHLSSTIVPSHPTLYRLYMWSSWVRRKGTTQVMYIVKLKDGPKKSYKNFINDLEKVFEMV
jgi:hypothetical protein